MKLKAFSTMFLSLFFFCTTVQSANLCAKLSRSSAWSSGVFSVVDLAGVTVATTPLIANGSEGCTEYVKDGVYLIRFNGARGISSLVSEGIYGCLTTPYTFSGNDTVTVVFNNGQHPFNNNEFCKPS